MREDGDAAATLPIGHGKGKANRGFRSNCLAWALDLLEHIPLADLAAWIRDARVHDTERPAPLVESVARRDAVPVGLAARAERLVRDEMARSLRIGASEIAGWSSQQWTFSQRQRHPLYDPGRRREREAVRAFLDAAWGILALPRPEVRDVEAVATGTWRLWERSTEEPDWTAAISLARTYGDKIAYTTCGTWPR